MGKFISNLEGNEKNTSQQLFTWQQIYLTSFEFVKKSDQTKLTIMAEFEAIVSPLFYRIGYSRLTIVNCNVSGVTGADPGFSFRGGGA